MNFSVILISSNTSFLRFTLKDCFQPDDALIKNVIAEHVIQYCRQRSLTVLDFYM